MADDERPLTPEGIDAWVDQYSLPPQIPPAAGEQRPEQRLLADLQAAHRITPPMERSLARVWTRLTQSAASSGQPPTTLRLLDRETPQQQGPRRREDAVRAGQERPQLDLLRRQPQHKKGETFMRPKQIGSVAAVVTLAAAVALIVVLLHSAAPGARTGSSAGTPQTVPTATPTTVSAPKGEWVPIAGVANVTGQIMIAPSNPDVIYEDLTPMGGAATLTLRRSDDGGKTWHQLAQPTEQSLSFDESAILVSPLDPNTVFETLTFYTIPHPGFCQSSGLGGGYARLSGGPSCEVQFYSSNGGQSWSRLSLPVAGALGAPYSAGFDFPNSLEVLRPQGQRLYSAVSSNSTVNNVTFGGPNVRILASDDGGKTWQLVDSAIQASGQNACDFTPTSTGGTIFAITQTSDCYTQKNATTFLWRSDDGGAHWRQVGTLPGPATSMVLGSQGTGADPLIYADTSPYPQPGAVDSQIIVSQDGGKTWQDAPSAGFPDNPASDQGIGTAGPLTALSDGSVVKGFASQNNTVAFFAWKIGEKAWHQVTPSLQSTPAVQGMSYLQSCLIIVGADGKATFWAVAEETNGNSLFGYDQQ